jgi:hypothetical protein
MAVHYGALARAAQDTELAAFVPALLAARDDELAHAELCDRACVALRGTPMTAPLPPPEPITDVVLAIAIACCLGETLNVVLLQDELATCAGESATTCRLLADELVHARLGWEVLAAAATRRSLADLADPLTRSLTEALARDDGELAMAVAARRGELLQAALSEVVLPGLARFGVDVRLERGHQ